MSTGFFDTDFGQPIPWMADANPNIWIDFEIDLKSIKPQIADVPFGEGYNAETETMGTITEATADMRNIEQTGARDGAHTIPFWACTSLQELLEPHRKQKGKWMQLRYRRTIVLKKGVENSRAEFALELSV